MHAHILHLACSSKVTAECARLHAAGSLHACMHLQEQNYAQWRVSTSKSSQQFLQKIHEVF